MDADSLVIVGAGAAGSTLALLLARYDIACTVVEQRTDPAYIRPRMSSTRAPWRSGTGPPRADARPGIDHSADRHGQHHSLVYRRPHRPLGEIDLLSQPDRLAEVRTHSPYLISHIGQHLLMPVLWDALDNEDLIDFRRGVAPRWTASG